MLPARTVEEAIAELEPAVEEVENADSDVEGPDEEDDERDALQERAAEVFVDSEHATPPEEPAANTIAAVLFAPPMPDLEFKVTRHLFRSTRHCCVKGNHVICQEGLLPQYGKTKYGPAVTHDAAFCPDCLRAATDDYKVVSPERFVHGEIQTNPPVSDSSGTGESKVSVAQARRTFLSRLIKSKT